MKQFHQVYDIFQSARIAIVNFRIWPILQGFPGTQHQHGTSFPPLSAGTGNETTHGGDRTQAFGYCEALDFDHNQSLHCLCLVFGAWVAKISDL